MSEKIVEILLGIMSLFFIVNFKKIGKDAIEQRKRINKFLPFPNKEEDFGESSILISRILFLLIGVIILMVSLAKLFS